MLRKATSYTRLRGNCQHTDDRAKKTGNVTWMWQDSNITGGSIRVKQNNHCHEEHYVRHHYLELAKSEVVSQWKKGHCSSRFSVFDIIEDLLSMEPKLTDSISLSEMNAVH